MKKKCFLLLMVVSILFSRVAYADDLNQVDINVDSSGISDDGKIGSQFSIVSAKVSFPEIENYYPQPGDAYVIQKAQLRSAASTNSPSKGTLEIGTKVHIIEYEGDWARTDNGYIYAGLLSDKYTFKANIHGKNTNSLRYAGYLYKSICDLEEPLKTLAENTSITLVDSQKNLCNEYEELGERTAGYTLHYAGTNKSEIRIWANTGSMQKDIIHELGHVLDYSEDGSKGVIYSDADEWNQIFEEEKDVYYKKLSNNKHDVSDQKEYFASCVESYTLKPEEFESIAPKSYDYIQKFFC